MFDSSTATTTLTMPEWMLASTEQRVSPVKRKPSGAALFGLSPEVDWVTPLSKPVTVFRPKTALARRLWEIRQQIVASGAPLLDWDGVERTLAERRGE
ncbi:MAG: hypothetical protein H8D34_22430 [Chloroflexi bacterium]|nr:hypothetical protein [Chloroflexota bacterium]